MKEYTIVKKGETLDWDRVPALSMETQEWSSKTDISAIAKICYDAENLYVYLEAKEKHIRAVEKMPAGSPCQDSCLEFFFRPDINDERYMNFEFSPTACYYVGIGRTVDNLVRLVPDGWDPFEAKPVYTDDGWYITYRIPLSFIRIYFPNVSFTSGKEIRANCYKCGDCTEIPHYMAWCSLPYVNSAFHQPKYFGLMRFA